MRHSLVKHVTYSFKKVSLVVYLPQKTKLEEVEWLQRMLRSKRESELLQAIIHTVSCCYTRIKYQGGLLRRTTNCESESTEL
jgi:hypothetical protein